MVNSYKDKKHYDKYTRIWCVKPLFQSLLTHNMVGSREVRLRLER